MDFLGWYTTGEEPTDKDLEVHRQFVEYNESPVFLKLNPNTTVGDLPITVYESVIDLVGGEATMLFIDLPYTLATEEAERIGVDHVARMTANETGASSLGKIIYLTFSLLFSQRAQFSKRTQLQISFVVSFFF